MLLKLAWRNIWRNKRRSMITIFSIMVAVILAVFMRAMQLGMYDNMIKNVVGSYSGYVQVHQKGFWEEQNLDNAITFNDSLTRTITKIPGVIGLVPRLQSFSLASVGSLSKGVLLNGIDPDKEAQISNTDNKIIAGSHLPEEGNFVVIGKGIASYLGLQPLDSIILLGQGYHGMSAAGIFVVSGVVDLKNPNINNSAVFMPLSTAQEYLSAHNIITNIVIAKDETADEKEIAQNIVTELDTAKYEVMTWQEMLPELDQLILADNVGGQIMIFILYMIITFGIFGTILMMTQERIYEFGVLISIGMQKTKLMWTVIMETLMLSMVGVLCGMICVMPLVYYFHAHPIVLTGDSSKAIEQYGFEPVMPLMDSLSIPITHGGIIFIISCFVVLYPIVIIQRLKTVKAMRR